jgi:hypothetical protein
MRYNNIRNLHPAKTIQNAHCVYFLGVRANNTKCACFATLEIWRNNTKCALLSHPIQRAFYVALAHCVKRKVAFMPFLAGRFWRRNSDQNLSAFFWECYLPKLVNVELPWAWR